MARSNCAADKDEWQNIWLDFISADGALDETTNAIQDPVGLDLGLLDTLHAAQQQLSWCENVTPKQGRISDVSKADPLDAASTLVDLGSAEYVHAAQQQLP
ncbi:MAG: hypothetical protein M1840_007592 [Geoglossum simile]|nr:MAG: hypothetical protein M1840_007592 [Geoglossum simile]